MRPGGDFKKAAAVIRQTTPFLYLLARTCSAPCQKACTLSRLGEGVRVRDLELACALYGGPAGGSRFLIPRKNKKVLVAGGRDFLPWPAAGNWERRGMRFTGIRPALLSRPPFWRWACPRKRRRRICRNFLLCGSPGKRRRNFPEKPWRTGAAGRTPSACPPELVFGRLPENGFTGPAGKETVWILAAARGTRPCRRTAIFRGLPRRAWRNQRYTKAASM